MKRILAGIVSTAIAVVLGVSAASANQLDDIKQRGKLVCGMTIVQPFAYLDPQTRELIGYERDLCDMLAADLGVEPERKIVAADVRVPELNEGRVDLLVALMSWTKARAEVIDYSGQYVSDGFYFIVRDDSAIKEVDELADKRISAAKGSLYQTIASRRFPNANVIAFDDGPLAFLAMQQGKVDATIQRSAAAVGLQLRSPKGSPEIRLLEPPLVRAGSGFGIRKNEPEFKAYLNAFLANMEKSGSGQKLWDKWLGADSDYKLKKDFVIGEQMGE